MVPPFEICHIPQSLYSVKPMSYIPNTRQRKPQTTISKKKIHFRVAQFILYRNVVVLTPLQNIFKMFPHISAVENIDFPKAYLGILQITIKAFLFNLDRWF